MEKIKEVIVKYGRLILDISVAVEVVVVVLCYLIASVFALSRGSFLILAIALVSGILALLSVVIFNYLVYLAIDIRDNLAKLENK